MLISNRNLVLYFSVLTFSFSACNPRGDAGAYRHVEDIQLRQILQRAIESAGGWNSWQSLKGISYTKRSVLYLENGQVESDVIQQHSYQLLPALTGEILWEADGNLHKIIYSADSSYKKVNGTKITGSEQSSKEAFLSAYYVLFIPFKLLDPGTNLQYLGTVTLESGTIVDVICATYAPDEHSNHSTSDTWWYYFDKNDGRHVGSMVYHEPTYALIEHRDMTDNHAIRFNIYRESFRSDSLRKKQYLRARFWYSDYDLKETK